MGESSSPRQAFATGGWGMFVAENTIGQSIEIANPAGPLLVFAAYQKRMWATNVEIIPTIVELTNKSGIGCNLPLNFGDLARKKLGSKEHIFIVVF